MKRSSTATTFFMASVAWVLTSPLFFAGALLAFLAWPLIRGFKMIWWTLED